MEKVGNLYKEELLHVIDAGISFRGVVHGRGL